MLPRRWARVIGPPGLQHATVSVGGLDDFTPLSASALHRLGFLEAAVGGLHHDSSSSGCTKSKHIINNHYARANYAHYANYANQTHGTGS